MLRIPIDKIHRNSNSPYHENKIGIFQKLMTEGRQLSPIRVGAEYKLADGYNRIEAAKRLRHTHVLAKIMSTDNGNRGKKNYRTFFDMVTLKGCHSSGAIRFVWDYFREGTPDGYVEVGVAYGANVERLRRQWPDIRMYLVDPWLAYYLQRQPKQDEYYKITLDKFEKDEKIEIIKKYSIDAARDFLCKGKQFDMVFIDGDHKYEEVIKDIESWYLLVRNGGILCGHDYSMDHPGVSKAVKEVFGKRHSVMARGFGDIWFHIKDDFDVRIEMIASGDKYEKAADLAIRTFWKYTDFEARVCRPKREFSFEYNSKLRLTTQLKPQGFLHVIKELRKDEIVIFVDSDTYCVKSFGLSYPIIDELSKGKIMMVPEPWNRYESLHGNANRPDYIPEDKRLTYVNSGVIMATRKTVDIFEKFVELSRQPGFSLGPFHDQTIINYALCHCFPDRIAYLDKRWNGICTTDENTIIGHNGGGVGTKLNRHYAVCDAVLKDRDWLQVLKEFDKGSTTSISIPTTIISSAPSEVV